MTRGRLDLSRSQFALCVSVFVTCAGVLSLFNKGLKLGIHNDTIVLCRPRPKGKGRASHDVNMMT